MSLHNSSLAWRVFYTAMKSMTNEVCEGINKPFLKCELKKKKHLSPMKYPNMDCKLHRLNAELSVSFFFVFACLQMWKLQKIANHLKEC